MVTSISLDIKQRNLELFQSYQKSKSSIIRNQIVQLNLGLIRKEAHYWTQQCNETYDDLEQVGCFGLITAIEKFDPSKGYAFSTFALPYIRGEIQHYLRDKSNTVKIPRRWLNLIQQAAHVNREYQSKSLAEPSTAEIAQALGVDISEWEAAKLAYQNRQPVSLDAPVHNDDEYSNLGDLLPDKQYHSFQLAQEDQLRVQQGLVKLEQHTREILEFVFLHDLTQKEVAQQLNISVITVSRHVKKGLNILKSLLANSEE